jgi:excisionase family DNA binding protein
MSTPTLPSESARRLAEALDAAFAEALAVTPPPIEHAPLLRADAAAERLGITVGQLYKMVRRGQIRGVRVGRLVNIPAGEIDRFIAENPA